MQSATIYYVQPVTFYSCLYVFIFHGFSNISKTVLEFSHIWFCREFQALSFDKKRFFKHRNNRGEILKILTGPFFLGHPLYLNVQYNYFILKILVSNIYNHKYYCTVFYLRENSFNTGLFHIPTSYPFNSFKIITLYYDIIIIRKITFQMNKLRFYF